MTPDAGNFTSPAGGPNANWGFRIAEQTIEEHEEDYFCLDRIRSHGRLLTILWDKTGSRYGKGRGLWVLVDGKEIGHSGTLSRVSARLRQ